MQYTGLATALLLSACTSVAQETPLEQALADQFDAAIPAHQSATVDLNADGFDDALVYALGPDWCGSASCTLFVFKGSAEGYELLSKTTIVQLPLAVSAQQTAGWKDLIVHAKGVGDVVLKATNQGYPLNPSMQPQATAADLEYSQQLLNYQQP